MLGTNRENEVTVFRKTRRGIHEKRRERKSNPLPVLRMGKTKRNSNSSKRAAQLHGLLGLVATEPQRISQLPWYNSLGIGPSGGLV